jgi:hypothetical protein
MSKTIETRDRHIDTNTGEVIYDKTNVISFTHLPNEPEYIKLYINDLGGLCKLSDGQRSILLYMAACSGYDGVIMLPLGQKVRIANTANCSVSAINNAINCFCKNKILKRLDTGLYELNPDYFARGKWKEIRERRKAFYTTITYTPDGQRVVKTDSIEPSSLDVTQ